MPLAPRTSLERLWISGRAHDLLPARPEVTNVAANAATNAKRNIAHHLVTPSRQVQSPAPSATLIDTAMISPEAFACALLNSIFNMLAVGHIAIPRGTTSKTGDGVQLHANPKTMKKNHSTVPHTAYEAPDHRLATMTARTLARRRSAQDRRLRVT
jgi:hypothetical protein